MYVKSFCGKPALRLTLADTNLETGAYVSQVNYRTQSFWVKGVLLVKFIYSEEATKFCEIFPLLLTVCSAFKSKRKILQYCVAFSEYMNFNKRPDQSIAGHEPL